LQEGREKEEEEGQRKGERREGRKNEGRMCREFPRLFEGAFCGREG